MGRPEPFALRFVEIGNEDFFAADTYSAYRWREFVTALSTEFPSIRMSCLLTLFRNEKPDTTLPSSSSSRVYGDYEHIRPCPHTHTATV